MGFVNNVPELLQVCDFVVSKPGGAQTTESLYFKKPIIMINHSGGQEVANFKYFEKNGYGKRFRTQFMFNLFMKKISNNPSIIDKMRKNISVALDIDIDRVNVKATPEEGLGFSGEGLGAAAHAVALIEKQ